MAIELIGTTVKSAAPTSKDLNLASGTEARVYSLQYNTIQNNGTLTLLPGDLRSISTFLGLTDTPSSYSGQAGKVVKVNAAENALEFGTAGASTFIALTDTPSSYSGQAGKVVRVNTAENALEFGTAGASTFLALTDTPSSYTGQAGKLLAVAQGENGIEFIQNQMGFVHTWSERVDGALAVATDVSGFVAPRSMVITAVYIRCKNKGTSGSTIVDVNKNGASIYTNQNNRPTLPHNYQGNSVSGGEIGTPNVQAGDVITFDIDSVATGASDLDITVEFSGSGSYSSSPPPSSATFYLLQDRTIPNINDFSWVNQGSASASYSPDWGIYMYAPNGSGDQWRILCKTLQYSSNYKVTVGIFPQLFDVDFHYCGLLLLDNSNKMVAIARKKLFLTQGSKWNSPSSFNSLYGNELGTTTLNPIFFRFVDDGTYRYALWSPDGLNYLNMHAQVSRTDFITPTKVGFGINCNNQWYPAAMTVFHFKEEQL